MNRAHQLMIYPKTVIENFCYFFHNDDLDIKESEEEILMSKQMMWREIYGEFIATTILFVSIFGVLANGYQNKWNNETISFTTSLLSGFQVCALAFTFTDMSGCHLNCAITFALWLTKRLTNWKLILYIMIQLTASIFATIIIYLTFMNANKDLFTFISLKPKENSYLSQVFLTEFICTFILSYVAFTTAFEENKMRKKETISLRVLTNSQGIGELYSFTPHTISFAPFAIGFTVFSLSLYGGSSGISLNPCRM